MDQSIAEVLKEIIRDNLISAAVIRIGIIFLTVFLVSILVVFYKYNIRMASFYESRWYSLILSGQADLERVKTFSKVLSTDKLDFEKEEVKSKDLLETVKGILDKLK